MEHFALMSIGGIYLVGFQEDFEGTMMSFDNIDDALETIYIWNAFVNGGSYEL